MNWNARIATLLLIMCKYIWRHFLKERKKLPDFQTGKPKPNSVIYILTADNSALCGVSFKIGETYLIVGK